MTEWSREAALNEVREELWRYLSAAAHPEAVAAVAEGLFDLGRGDLRRLTAAHLLMEPTTREMLDAVERLLPRMPANTQQTDVELVGHVVGPVDWAQTRQLQLASGDRTRFICRPPARHYDSSLVRLITFSLQACDILGQAAALSGESGPARLIIDAARTRSWRLRQHVKLSDARAMLPSARDRGALARRPGAAPVVSFANRFVDAYELLDATTTRSVIESSLLAPAADHTLFELQVGFRIVHCFMEHGYRRERPAIIEPGQRSPFVVLTRGRERVSMWWQRSTYATLRIDGGLYSEALTDARRPSSPLRPDFVLKFEPADRAVLVEVKHTSRETAPIQAGIRDALLYLMDVRAAFDDQPFPHALVVATGASLGAVDARIIVCDVQPSSLRATVAAMLRSHSQPEAVPAPG